MSVNISPIGGAGWQFFDNNGVPLSGGKLYTYLSGTTTPATTYTTSAGVTPHTNPIILDSAGRVPGGEIWLLTPANYKFVVKTSTDVTIGTYDNIPSVESSDASLVEYVPAGTGAIDRTVESKLRDTVSVFDFMTAAQIADVQSSAFTLDATAAVQAAIDYAATIGKWLYVPAGLYKLIPSTPIIDEDTSYTTYAAFLMRSKMHIWAEPGAIFKIANGVSTDAGPKSMGMFCTDVPLGKVSICNLTMDMNGQNNPISPNRPTSYNRFNQSPILVSGQPGGAIVAYMDDVLIENCRFLNNPGASDIVCAQSNSAGVGLGRRWRILNNTFAENGLDTDDHTAVFAWAEEVEFSGNIVYNSTPFATVGRTGGNTCYEVHGNRHRVTNNLFYNYYRGVWVSSNLTNSEAQDTIISNNNFRTCFYGVDFFRTTAALGKSTNTLISGNTFRFDTYTFAAPVPTDKVAVQIASEYEQGYVLIDGNTVTSTDNVVGALFFQCATQGIVGQPHSDIVVSNNNAKGCRLFASVDTGSAVSGVGNITFHNNTSIEPILDPAHTIGIGIYIEAPAAIKTLKISDNNFIDNRVPSKLDYGVYIASGTIGYFYYRKGTVKNANTAAYYEGNPLTINYRDGFFDRMSFTPVWTMSGTAVTVGNGAASGVYTLQDTLVTLTAKLVIGSTTVIPAGYIYLTLPFTAALSGQTYLGSARIVDSAPSLTIYLVTAAIDGTGTVAVFDINGATQATHSTPVALAAGDSIDVQITYYRN